MSQVVLCICDVFVVGGVKYGLCCLVWMCEIDMSVSSSG